MKRAALYARVSTGGQTVENQLRELRAVATRLGWEVVAEFVDEGISGAKGRDKRPALDSMLKCVIRGEVEVVAAWSVDRLAQSLPKLSRLLEKLRAYGADLYLHEQELDTSTHPGRALFETLPVVAALEKAIVSGRTKARMAAAKAQGKRISRPPVDPTTVARIRLLRADGHSLRWIAEEVGVGRGTVEKYVKSPQR